VEGDQFRKVLAEHPDRPAINNLEDLFRKLETMQRAIRSLDQGDRLLRDQLLNAVRDYPACHTALQIPAETYEGVCGQLRTAISLANGQNGAAQYTSTSNWTDRTYKGSGRQDRFGRNNKRTARSAADLKCYVCGKQGCWSTKHSKEDRRKAYDRYKSDRNTRDKSKVTYNSFLAWYEGVDDGLDTDEEDSPVLQYLQSMGIDDDSSDNNEEQVPGPLHTSAFEMTAFLQNMSTRHLLTKEDPFRGFLATGAVPPACDDLTAMGDLFILTRYDEMSSMD